MEQILKVDDLNKLLTTKNKHTVGDAIDVLPFLTKRTKAIKENFNGVLGEYIRRVCEVELAKNKRKESVEELLESDNELVSQILKQVSFDDENSKNDLERFIGSFLFNEENEIKPIHPYLFNYVPVPEKYDNEFNKYAQFLKDAFAGDSSALKETFNQKVHHDILTELILENIESLKDSKPKEQNYQSMLPSITGLYQEDLLYLSHHQEYFLQSFELLTHFYMMTYVCQLILKLERFESADYSEPSPLYYALDWESVSKRRKPADELEGFKFIKDKSSNLFVHIHTLSHLSHNRFNTSLSNNKKPLMNYKELYDLVTQKGQEDVLLKDLKAWIENYSEWQKMKDEPKPQSLEEAFSVMFSCLKHGMSTTVCEKYGKNIEDLGSGRFIKSRGSLGHVLNINHEMLLLLTAVSVKDKRIPLNQLFEEFEKRGVMFDRYSKKEIIALFDSLNILDKKSDSGDAQYVKPIL
ncbi:DNA phosphorothioation-dependent restriction protein DptG [Bacillus hwajinpoensis]|uniref:DNA phosphorothioation-dependent restriction protein DptG n=1 Tax=Guptibacillus hwajinpoensis TaxID=208199 RepID=A0A845F0V3_9BACL|nr:DNA phosphorothioation-dependent restriction protein DptG [Pseudalkalibacillus hwajinpoensis]MYL64374.1 DNA phosphorothioation-dependent restriction protein DptG [Pseudalkalibacillus hwajinpoensis]